MESTNHVKLDMKIQKHKVDRKTVQNAVEALRVDGQCGFLTLTTSPQSRQGLSTKTPEVVPAAATDQGVVDAVCAFAESLGKTPITVPNRPGFIVNRLLFAMIAEALRIVDEGGTSAQDVDRALCLGASHPIGPLALADFIGLDVVLDILESLASGLGAHYAPSSALRERVSQGHLGRKTGRGFFSY